MKKTTISLVLSLLAKTTFAQIDSSYYVKSPSSITSLKPITEAKNKYYLGNEKLENSAALAIPFSKLNDSSVTYHYKKARYIRKISRNLLWAVPIAYIFAAIKGRTRPVLGIYSFAAIAYGSCAASYGVSIFTKQELKKAISLYNQYRK